MNEQQETAAKVGDRVIVWHDRQFTKGVSGGKRNGRTVAVIWEGTKRFIGIMECSAKESFVKKKGWAYSYARAHHLFLVDKGQKTKRASDDGDCFKATIDITKPYNSDHVHHALKVPLWMLQERTKEEQRAERSRATEAATASM